MTAFLHSNNGQQYLLDNNLVTIGRDPSNQIFLLDESISRQHASFQQIGNDWYLTDLDSSNGTFVNNIKIVSHQSTLLTNADIIQFGKQIKLQFLMTNVDPALTVQEQVVMPSVNICPNCGHSNRNQSSFCGRCGQPVHSPNALVVIPSKEVRIKPQIGSRISGAQEKVVEVAQKISYKAVFSLIFGIAAFMGIPFIGSILAIVWGSQARREIKESDGRLWGAVFANSGLLLGWTGAILACSVSICGIFSMGSGFVSVVTGIGLFVLKAIPIVKDFWPDVTPTPSPTPAPSEIFWLLRYL